MATTAGSASSTTCRPTSGPFPRPSGSGRKEPQQSLLRRDHRALFLGVPVIVAEQVQDTVDKEEGGFAAHSPRRPPRQLHPLATGSLTGEVRSLALHAVHRQHDVPQQVVVVHGEGEDVRRRVHPAVDPVEVSNRRIVGQEDGELGVRAVERVEDRLRPPSEGPGIDLPPADPFRSQIHGHGAPSCRARSFGPCRRPADGGTAAGDDRCR